MKNIILSLILFILCPASFSQTTAYTEDGEEIILYDNFTWKYANSNDMHHDHLNNGTNKNFQGIRKIDVYSDGNLRIAFWINNHRMTFYDGKISFNDMQPSRIEYYDFAFSKKNNGKIKEIKFDNITISFQYIDNTIFETSEGKIKSITVGNITYDFEYYDITICDLLKGKLESISSNMNKIEFKYHDNSFYSESCGKLKEINGKIPDIIVKYLEMQD